MFHVEHFRLGDRLRSGGARVHHRPARRMFHVEHSRLGDRLRLGAHASTTGSRAECSTWNIPGSATVRGWGAHASTTGSRAECSTWNIPGSATARGRGHTRPPPARAPNVPRGTFPSPRPAELHPRARRIHQRAHAERRCGVRWWGSSASRHGRGSPATARSVTCRQGPEEVLPRGSCAPLIRSRTRPGGPPALVPRNRRPRRTPADPRPVAGRRSRR